MHWVQIGERLIDLETGSYIETGGSSKVEGRFSLYRSGNGCEILLTAAEANLDIPAGSPRQRVPDRGAR